MSVLTFRPTRRRLPPRLLLVLLAVLIYIGVDDVAFFTRTSVPNWGLRVDAGGWVTWIDPNGLADARGVRVGDRVALPAGVSDPRDGVLRQPVLRLQGHRQLVWRSSALTWRGQALVFVGVLLLLVGGVVWASGRKGRASTVLCLLGLDTSLVMLGTVWAQDGCGWAMRLAFVTGGVLFPLLWAAFFVSFPRDRLAQRRWRLPFALLLALAPLTLLAFMLSLWCNLPYALVRVLLEPLVILGLTLGLTAVLIGGRGETPQARQQRRIVALSAAGAMLPALLLSYLPFVLSGHTLVAYEVTALAVIVLPLGLAYAIVRYDLMELDVVVRRLVAGALGACTLIALTAVATLVLHPLLPGLDLLPLMVAVLAGASGGRHVGTWSRRLAERLLSPELVRSRQLLVDLETVILRGEEDLALLATRLEEAAREVVNVPWARLLVRRRVPGAVFYHLHDGASPVSIPLLASSLSGQPWGVGAHEGRGFAASREWSDLSTVLQAVPAILMPVRMHGEVIAILAVGHGSAPLRGPDREALALLTAHVALAVDHARICAELEAEGAGAAALSAATARLTTALDDRPSLPHHIVSALASLRDVRGVGLHLYDPRGTLIPVAERGEKVLVMEPENPAHAYFTPAPVPYAWLPLMVGGVAIGGLGVRWRQEHAIREHDRRLLTVYANGAAMALEHARLYEHARIQAERDPVTDLYNHRAFHAQLEAALERVRAGDDHVGLLLIDVADFKLFNDTHGHQAGDQALRRVGEVLQACCRTSDVAARLGGDEFAVLLPGATIEVAYTIAERITDLAALSELTSPEGQRLPIHLSLGAAAYPLDAAAANALLARADERMYAAKRAGVPIAAAGRAGETNKGDETGGRFGILEALVAMVDNRDRYTGTHSEQVAAYACAIAAELGLSPDTLKTLRLAGLLHDVGKIGVPDRILRKPDKLTDEEFDVVRRHVELSEVLLTVVSQDRDLMDAVRHHHERWDGCGYPRRVAGEKVPLLGRIMIVADAVSAMGMDRPYRKGLPWAYIAQELVKGDGSQFDPALVPVAARALRPLLERNCAA